MSPAVSSLAEVHAAIDRVRSRRGAFHTNYFQQPLVGRVFHLAATDHSVVFLNEDIGFHRAYYFSRTAGELRTQLAALVWPAPLVIGYITKQEEPELLAAFGDAGFARYCTFQKMRCDALPAGKTNSRLKFANPAQLDELYARLLADFDRYSEHLPSPELLAEYIARQWVIINTDEKTRGRITGYVIFQIIGHHVNCNFILNSSGNALDWLLLQKNFYGLMAERGIRRGFIWVRSTNREVIEMYKLQGWYFDAVADHFFLKQPA